MKATITTLPYLHYALDAFVKSPTSREDSVYMLIIEFLIQHKMNSEFGSARFVIYPQMSLRWNPGIPKDTCREVTDFGVGNPRQTQPFLKLRFVVEAKRTIDIMHNLPSPRTIEGHGQVLDAFNTVFFQGEDQAKAAVRSGYANNMGPYWTDVAYGPFTPGQLGIRSRKLSDGADYQETLEMKARLAAKPIRRTLYLLGTEASHRKLAELFEHGDNDPEIRPLIQQAQIYSPNQ